MKELLLSLVCIVLVVSPTYAQGQERIIRTENSIKPSDNEGQQGNLVKNEVKTKNAGEENELQVRTAEKLEAKENATRSGNRSEVARQNMSEVAKQVESLLDIKDDGTGLGSQVREIAREQNQAQEKIKGELDKLDSRGRFMKTLFGADPEAIENLRQQMEQNRVRIQQLQELKTQTQNQADENQMQETIKVMIDQNTALADQIQTEEQTKGLFSWLARWFAQ
jgi:hypothetical protein